MRSVDPAAKTPSRVRRNWGRATKGALTGTLNTVLPVTLDAQARLVLNIATNGGIDTTVGALKLKLDTTPGLTTSATGLKILLDATNPCLQLTSGLAVTVHAAGALTKTSTGLQVAVDGSTVEINTNAVRVKDLGITGAKIANAAIDGTKLVSGLTLPPFKLSESANGVMGTATLTAGSVIVNNIRVTALTRIFLTSVTPGGTVGFWSTATRTPSTSFTIASTSAADTSTVAFLLIEPV